MLTLALDTSNLPLSVAVIADGQPLAMIQTAKAKNHSATLMPAIDQALSYAGVELAAVTRIVVAMGPGSYTGVRIAITTAKMLAWTLKIPLYGVSSLAALTTAWRWQHTSPLIVPLIDARRDCYFAGFYRWSAAEPATVQSLQPDQYLAAAQIVAQAQALASTGPIVVTGQLTESQQAWWRQAWPDAAVTVAAGSVTMPNAADFDLLATPAQQVQDLNGFAPNYLRPTEAEATWLKNHPGEAHENFVEEV